mmetsp:Transcript_112/g.309  ORF Transcript_112/g.309 Transcript_112/m.309 type:complete len:298 (+) Transcript_112:54-947(+)
MSLEETKAVWLEKFREALGHDNWGQILEGCQKYELLAGELVTGIAQQAHTLKSKDSDALHKIAKCLTARALVLKGQSSVPISSEITAVDMKEMEKVFVNLFTPVDEPFPIAADKFLSVQAARPMVVGAEIVAGEAAGPLDTDLFEAAAAKVAGRVVCLRVSRIGLKDAETYIDPVMTVSVADSKTVFDTQDITEKREERSVNHVVFDKPVYLHVGLEDIHARKAAIFFEFKHYKPKKKKMSTRCWCFMEADELKWDEEFALEIYHKPTDLKRKKLSLHSEKPLYLHVLAQHFTSKRR